MKYNLPRGRLSYSEVSNWLKNREQYRARYYRGEKGYLNAEMVFGGIISKKIEDNDPEVAFIPRYSNCEHFIKVELDDVPIGGHLDSFDPEENRFRETKTSHLKEFWNPVSVAKHMQLDFYSLLIEKKYGKVTNLCHLDWVETEFKTKTMEFGEHTLTAQSRELFLTGKVVTFPRKIEKWERDYMAKTIVRVAEEISRDYTLYQIQHPTLVVDLTHLDR